MRRTVTIASLLIPLLGCSDDDSPAPDAAPPFDAGQDMFEWTSEWRHEPRIEIHDNTPCEPWETVEAPLQRALPTDPTPRVLWQFIPADDPRYEGSNARFQSRVEAPVVSPDGTIWVQGPSYDQVMRVDRSGAMLNWYGMGSADWEDTDDLTRQGPITVAPNGHLVSVVYTLESGGQGYIVLVDPDSPNGDAYSNLLVLPAQLGANSLIAIAPDGMVYVNHENRIFGTCRAERLLWTLTNALGPGEEDSGRISGMWVDEDGSLLATGSMQRMIRVRAGVVDSEEVPHDDVDPSDLRYLLRWTPEVRLFGFPRFAEDRPRWLIQAAEGDVVVETDGGQNLLSPNGEVFLISFRGTLGPRPYPYTTSRDSVETSGPWFEDDSWLVRSTIMSRRHYDYEAAEEVVDWTLDLTTQGVVGGMSSLRMDYVIDETGIGYFVLLGGLGGPTQLLAVQLDALPPTPDRCVNTVGCNASRDRYVRPSE